MRECRRGLAERRENTRTKKKRKEKKRQKKEDETRRKEKIGEWLVTSQKEGLIIRIGQAFNSNLLIKQSYAAKRWVSNNKKQSNKRSKKAAEKKSSK